MSQNIFVYLKSFSNFRNLIPRFISFMHPYDCGIHICMMVRVFVNGLGDRGSILGRAYQRLKKMVLDAFLLNTRHYNVRIKSKCSNPGRGVAIGKGGPSGRP